MQLIRVRELGLQAVSSMEFIVRALRGWSVPLVLAVPQSWQAFDPEGHPTPWAWLTLGRVSAVATSTWAEASSHELSQAVTSARKLSFAPICPPR